MLLELSARARDHRKILEPLARPAGVDDGARIRRRRLVEDRIERAAPGAADEIDVTAVVPQIAADLLQALTESALGHKRTVATDRRIDHFEFLLRAMSTAAAQAFRMPTSSSSAETARRIKYACLVEVAPSQAAVIIPR